jgi:hypothetical protein
MFEIAGAAPPCVDALKKVLMDTAARQSLGPLRTALLTIHRALERGSAVTHCDELRRIVAWGEVEGSIAVEEAILIERLVYRLELWGRRESRRR